MEKKISEKTAASEKSTTINFLSGRLLFSLN